MLQAGSTRLKCAVERIWLLPGAQGSLPALFANFSPSSSSVEDIYTLWVQKRLLEGKRKGRERKRMKMILIFFFFLA